MPRMVNNQERGVGISSQIVPVHQVTTKQHMAHGESQHTVCTWANRDPLIGYSLVARANWVDGNEFGATALELLNTNLDRIRGMILSHPPQHEILCSIPVGIAEFPERLANAVEPRSGHVHRTEAAMGRPINGAELLGPQTGQGLHLVSPGEKCQLLWIGRAYFTQSFG